MVLMARPVPKMTGLITSAAFAYSDTSDSTGPHTFTPFGQLRTCPAGPAIESSQLGIAARTLGNIDSTNHSSPWMLMGLADPTNSIPLPPGSSSGIISWADTWPTQNTSPDT